MISLIELLKNYNFSTKKYRNIPRIKMSEPEFKERVRQSYKTKQGIFIDRMNKNDFDNWIGNENVHNNKLKVYRGSNVNISNFRNGDFCTTNPEYAKQYGKFVISDMIPLKKLKYVRGHKNGNPSDVTWNSPVELVYVDVVDKFSDAFKTFEYKKYLEFLDSTVQ